MSELRGYRGVGVASVVAMLALAACGGQIDPNATGKTSTRQTGTGASGAPSNGSTGNSIGGLPSSSSSSSGASSSGDVAPNIGPCGGTAVPFFGDFEDGTIDASFAVNTPSAFEVDYDDPISGSASLKINPTPASYIARKAPNVCNATLKFHLRASAEFIAGGGNIARINAGSRRFTIAVSPGGAVGLLEEVYTTGAAGMGGAPPFGTLVAGVTTTVYLNVDLVNERREAMLDTGSGPPAQTSGMMGGEGAALQTPPAISSIELGSTPGFAIDPHGVYWIDDLEIL